MESMHPGQYLKSAYIDTKLYDQQELAVKLGVSPSALCRVLSGKAELSAEFALKLEAALGRSAESWMYMQMQHTLSKLRVSKGIVEKIEKTEEPSMLRFSRGRVVELD